MKNMLKILLLSFMLALPLTAGATDKASDQTKAEQTAPDVAKFDQQLAQMRGNMQKMQEQMGQIQKTQDPQERQKLLQDHWTTMQSAMQTMHGMWGPGMMGCCEGNWMMNGGMMDGNHMGMMGPMMGWNDMHGYYSKLTPDQMKQRQYMTDQYTGMQQMMMDNMMWHQNWTAQPTH